jgi:hypothetical protein
MRDANEDTFEIVTPWKDGDNSNRPQPKVGESPEVNNGVAAKP